MEAFAKFSVNGVPVALEASEVRPFFLSVCRVCLFCVCVCLCV